MHPLLLVLAFPLAAQSHDARGFERPGFAPGALDSQNGWIGSAAGGGLAPVVVTAPNPAIGDQAVRLEVADVQGATSTMQIPIPDPLAAGITRVRVSFSIYREPNPFLTNLWWWWVDPGDPTYGLQWDVYNGQVGDTLPFGWYGTGTGSIPIGRFVEVELDYDFSTNMAEGWVDGQLVTTVAIQNVQTLTAFVIHLAHDEGAGSGPERVWIDDFRIASGPWLSLFPEPLQAGNRMAAESVNLRAGAPSALAFSLTGPGSTYVPRLQVTLDLANPLQAGRVLTSDAHGRVLWDGMVPGGLAGRSVWLQAAQFRLKTNLVATGVR
ncbi:MAG: hypothetical protein EYC70_07565 [Planctomycetota bacterium]|nr:MAG: hypothetical protein EYC70_07565 [Planctomycetota bacterium]